MLTSYTVKGFKSFMEETTVDLLPTNYKTLANQNIYDGVLKGALFVGANASGKSNIILPIKFLAELLFAKYDVSINDYVCLFDKEDLMKLTFDFQISGSHIKYCIAYSRDQKLVEEKLYVDNILLLDRLGNFAKSEISEISIFTAIADNMLILREIYFNTKFRNNDILIKWFEYLMNFIYVDLCEPTTVKFKDEILQSVAFTRKFGTDKMNDFFNKYNFQQKLRSDKVTETGIQISFIRNGIDVPIPLELESLGNQNLFRLLSYFFYVVENGGILILDEFSSGFHNDLEELLIKYFMENAKNAQLLFVSHSTNLLSNRLLRPDQIYTVEFESGKGSVINRVSKEQPREAQNLEKMYLGGVFGGLPDYSNNTEQE